MMQLGSHFPRGISSLVCFESIRIYAIAHPAKRRLPAKVESSKFPDNRIPQSIASALQAIIAPAR
jgi:hypothetical protein